jgi:hypothetical protein
MPPSHLLKINFVIFPSIPGFSKWSLSLRFPHQNPACTSSLPHTCYMPHPYHSPKFYRLNNIWWAVQSLSSSLYSFPHSCSLIPLRPKYFPLHPILKHHQPTFLPQCQQPSFTTIQTNRKNYSTVHLIFIVLDSKLEDKRFCTEW